MSGFIIIGGLQCDIVKKKSVHLTTVISENLQNITERIDDLRYISDSIILVFLRISSCVRLGSQEIIIIIREVLLPIRKDRFDMTVSFIVFIDNI